MTLQAKLDKQKKQSLTQIPETAQAIMSRATEELQKSEILDKILKAGNKAPEFSLPSAEGKIVSSKDLIEKGPLVVCFYRGVW
jgi:hypothetical protein